MKGTLIFLQVGVAHYKVAPTTNWGPLQTGAHHKLAPTTNWGPLQTGAHYKLGPTTKCHPERSEGSGGLPAAAILVVQARTWIPRYARDDKHLGMTSISG